MTGYHQQIHRTVTHHFYWMLIMIVRLVPRVLVTVVHVLVGTMKIYTYWLFLLDWFTFLSLIFFFSLSLAASLLEVARLTVDSNWVPPRPIIFLFNGAEELFMLVRHHGCALFGRNFFLILSFFSSLFFSFW